MPYLRQTHALDFQINLPWNIGTSHTQDNSWFRPKTDIERINIVYVFCLIIGFDTFVSES
jgi:hypothetical protein